MSSKFKVQSSKLVIKDNGQGRREIFSSLIPHSSSLTSGFTLLELIITLTVLAILVLGTIPLSQNAVKRQKEMRLRENLRTLRAAIDEFHRDTIGACPQGAIGSNNQGNFKQGGGSAPADPRSRVVVDDCKIFDTENIDRFPPSLEILVEGVKVRARAPNLQTSGAFEDKNATEMNEAKELTKVYLRELPVDPTTGETDWQMHSSYQTKDDGAWDEINVFDVRSASEEKALNGEKYSDW